MKRLLCAWLIACGGAATTPVTPPPRTPAPTTTPAPARPPAPPLPGRAALTGAITRLRVEGIDPGALRTAVEAALAPVRGKPLDSDELRAALDAAARVTGVADLTVRGLQLDGGIELVVEVIANLPLRNVVAREAGGKGIALGLAAPALGGPLDPKAMHALAETLRDRYAAAGYFDADASWKSTPIPGGVEVAIEIVPGERSAIAGFAFPGATRPSAELAAIVGKWLVIGQPVVELRVHDAADALSAYYWDRGYATVSVKAPEVMAGKMTVAFQISEGPQFKMGAIEITGIPAADRPRYLALFGVKAGDLFSRTAIATGRDKITQALAAAGKPGATVLPVTKVDVASKKIDLTLEITP